MLSLCSPKNIGLPYFATTIVSGSFLSIKTRAQRPSKICFVTNIVAL